MDTNKLVIAGSGPAGLTAAVYSARSGIVPIVLEGDQPGGQLIVSPDVENYPGFPEGVGGFELVDLMRKQAAKFGSEFVSAGLKAVNFEADPLQLDLSNGEQMATHALIIATGAQARYIGLESEQALIGKGVSGCATCDGAFYRDLPVAVVGGGDSAMEDALFLTRFASKVFLIHRRDKLRASKIMARRVLDHDKIELVWDSVVDEVLGVDKGEVCGLKLKNVKTDKILELDVKGLFVAIGHDPATKPFKNWLELDSAGYVKTHPDSTATDLPGVFAAGDVQDKDYRQAVTAAGSGCMAALEVERYLESLNK